MNAKKWFVIVGILNVALVAAFFFPEALRQQPPRGGSGANAGAGVHPAVRLARLAGSSLGFGTVIEATLPAARGDGETEILDLETGRWLTRPGIERFNDDAGAMMAWTRSNGLNISGRIWSDNSAACVTYNMTVVPVAAGCWEEAAAKVIPAIPALEPGAHSPSRLLLLRPGRPETYAFRTDEGTLGMLRLVGLGDDGRAVKIRYKLLQARGDVARGTAASGRASSDGSRSQVGVTRGSLTVSGSGNAPSQVTAT
jgi:hypothetical protein